MNVFIRRMAKTTLCALPPFLGMCSIFPAVAQPPVVPAPPAKPLSVGSSQAPGSGDNVQLLTVPGRNLMVQRLHPTSYPVEAEIRCGVAVPCLIGLTRGFTLGGDVFRMAATPVVGPIVQPGSWLLFDGFLGYQFLQNVDNQLFANGSVGYRAFSYRDSQGREAKAGGVTFSVSYAQEISPVYSQGLVFSGFQGKTKVSSQDNLYRRNSEGDETRKSIKKYYEFSQKFPRVNLRLPADVEVINWKNTHIDLPSHLRGYAHIEPFYLQNELSIDDTYTWVEKNFGLRVGATAAYESEKEKSGRYAFLVSTGIDLSGSTPSIDYQGKNQGMEFELPKRSIIDYYINLEASFQF